MPLHPFVWPRRATWSYGIEGEGRFCLKDSFSVCARVKKNDLIALVGGIGRCEKGESPRLSLEGRPDDPFAGKKKRRGIYGSGRVIADRRETPERRGP